MMDPARGPPPTLRIAVNAWFADQPTTGSGQYLSHLLNEFSQSKEAKHLLLCVPAGQSVPTDDRFSWQVLRTPFDGGPSSGASSRTRRHLAKLWFEQIAFVRAGGRWGADLLHVPYWAGPLHSRIPTVVTVHDLIPALLPAYSGGRMGRWYTRLVSHTARRAALVLTDSNASRQDILTHLRLPPDKVEAIPLAASADFGPVHDRRILGRVREKYALPDRYLLYLGGFELRKNVNAILRAYARLDLSDVSLVIAGRIPSRTSDVLRDPRPLAQDLGLETRVHLIGWVDERDKPALYSGALGFLFPSLYEGFGLPPLEAMSCGTPVIVSDLSSLPEIVGEAGLYVAPEDIEALAGAMHRLCTDAELRSTLGQAALTQAARFSWSQTARETQAAYRRAWASATRLRALPFPTRHRSS